ncbi:MAG: hypothetical protein P8R43_06800, partial [Planctomycetota bacterium]|nr:hypothetical protein [Planctomycetota bacterium]
MLNRFQFARLRGFRRGKKRAAEAEAARRLEEKNGGGALDRAGLQESDGKASAAEGGVASLTGAP